ncbi:histidine phosphatase family protein [Asticcacaulis sp. EMRT-3]|uniref:histidine phosphatase family protein n=1 Tax=Asticcacaulis sp. EMRT-3 TaxID=3040349 RepID=UPI0024AF1905|nr:histidine phosphatase family protein [Asticcacaulis sp. EMRT-3]MDI7775546.1 histidine phosphatase family protein [Asticcacaulis sp. EMRT-3]
MNASSPNRPHIYLIRHGRTEWSVSGRHTGLTDLPLTAQGEDQARMIAPRLGKIDFAHVLTSPLQRAHHTCQLAGLGAQAEITPDLAEWDYGDYEGLKSPEIQAKQPGWTIFRDGGPDGESAQAVSDRADRLVARLSGMEGNIALFSHGHFGRALAARWIGLPLIEAEHFTLGEAAMNILGYNPSHPDVRVISLWNLPPEL